MKNQGFPEKLRIFRNSALWSLSASLALHDLPSLSPDLRTRCKRAQTQLQTLQEVCAGHRASGSHQKSSGRHWVTTERNFGKSLIFQKIWVVSATAPHGGCIPVYDHPSLARTSTTIANARSINCRRPRKPAGPRGHGGTIRNHLGDTG